MNDDIKYRILHPLVMTVGLVFGVICTLGVIIFISRFVDFI